MTRAALSPRAQADLDEIWDFTAKRWGLDQAETQSMFPLFGTGSDGGILRAGQEGGEVRSGATVEPADAARAQKAPSLRVAMRRASASALALPDVPASRRGARLSDRTRRMRDRTNPK